MTNQVYNQSTAPLVIHYELFEVIPPDFDVGPNYVEAFVFTGATVP